VRTPRAGATSAALEVLTVGKLFGAAFLLALAAVSTASASASCPDDLCPTPEQIHGSLADSDGDGLFDSSFRATRVTAESVEITLVSFGGSPRWSFTLPHRKVLPDEPDVPSGAPSGDFTGDGVPDYVFTARESLQPASMCGDFVETQTRLVAVDGRTGARSTPLDPIPNKCWDFPQPDGTHVVYPTSRYPGFIQIGDLDPSYRGNEIAVVPAYPPEDRGWVLNYAQTGAWQRLPDPHGTESLVFPSHPDFETYYNAANPPDAPCKRPFSLRRCDVQYSHVPTGLIVNSHGEQNMFLMTTGRALIYRPDLTPTADTVWSSGDTPNGGRNYGQATFFSHAGRDYISLIGGCSVRVARRAMTSGVPPDGRLETSLGGTDAHCGIHHHYEWFEVDRARITDHFNRYYSYSVSDGFLHDRPEFPGNPVGAIGGPGSAWTVYNLFRGPPGSTGEGEWRLQLLPDPEEPAKVIEVKGWYVWDVVDLDGDGKSELLATRAPPEGSPRPYLLSWELDVLTWNPDARDGEGGLESIYHRDGVAPSLFRYPNAPTRNTGDGTLSRDADGDGVAEPMVEDDNGHRSLLRVRPLARAIPTDGGEPGVGTPGTSTQDALAPAGIPPKRHRTVHFRISRKSIRIGGRGVAAIVVSCRQRGACEGRIRLQSSELPRRGKVASRVTIGSGNVRVPGHRRSTIYIGLSRTSRAAVQSKGSLRVTATAELRRPAGDAAGSRDTVTSSIRLVSVLRRSQRLLP